MCGIVGVFNDKDAKQKVEKALVALHARGKDGKGLLEVNGGCIGHTLHAIVGNVAQPLKAEGVLVANCEIYNWKELRSDSKNDADMLLRLLDKAGVKILPLLDGVYAFAHHKDGKIVLARDIIGVKPLWYAFTDSFAFASEKKVLEKLGYSPVFELNPRHYLVYDVSEHRLESVEREYFKIVPEHKESEEEIVKKLVTLLESAVKKRIPNQKVGVLFSGGLDSTLIALLLKKFGVDFTCYTTAVDLPGMKAGEDLAESERVASLNGFTLKKAMLRLDDISSALVRIVPLIEDSNVVKVGVALTLDASLALAEKDGCKVVFGGLGSEELFAGYKRHKDARDINKECIAGLRKIYEGDTYRDDVVSMSHSIEMRVPFLDRELTEYALRIPGKFKIADDSEKLILRKAALALGMDERTAMRRKKAAQYGSNVHKALEKLAGKARVSDYLYAFYPQRQVRLASLLSTGKDSHYATYIMMKRNYNIKCAVTLVSKNPDSYMFHTPAIEIVKKQAEAMGMPLIVQETAGEKEDELVDLENALRKATADFEIEGVITGALFSTYQRDRIERICEKLGLKVFSPLWHIDQETEVRQIIEDGFKVVMVRVACDGLDASWLGRVLSHDDVDKLAQLKKKIGINIAGEGGEYETLVLDGPHFKNEISLPKFKVRTDGSMHEIVF